LPSFSATILNRFRYISSVAISSIIKYDAGLPAGYDRIIHGLADALCPFIGKFKLDRVFIGQAVNTCHIRKYIFRGASGLIAPGVLIFPLLIYTFTNGGDREYYYD
jgi:hypothetical protein